MTPRGRRLPAAGRNVKRTGEVITRQDRRDSGSAEAARALSEPGFTCRTAGLPCPATPLGGLAGRAMIGAMNRKLTALGVTVVASVLPATVTATAAHADETHTDAHNGPQVALIATGQIDDPLEDVLEHVAVLGRTVVVDH